MCAEKVCASIGRITTNREEISLPEAVYVADFTTNDKAVIERAKAELSYRGYLKGRRALVKMALLLNDVQTGAWVCHDNKLFSFNDIGESGLVSVVDEARSSGSTFPIWLTPTSRTT